MAWQWLGFLRLGQHLHLLSRWISFKRLNTHRFAVHCICTVEDGFRNISLPGSWQEKCQQTYFSTRAATWPLSQPMRTGIFYLLSYLPSLLMELKVWLPEAEVKLPKDWGEMRGFSFLAVCELPVIPACHTQFIRPVWTILWEEAIQHQGRSGTVFMGLGSITLWKHWGVFGTGCFFMYLHVRILALSLFYSPSQSRYLFPAIIRQVDSWMGIWNPSF